MFQRIFRLIIGISILTSLLIPQSVISPPVQAAPLPAPQKDLSFSTEVVDPNNGRGMDNATALDIEGVPHIAYYDQTNGDLLVATKSGESWFREEVDSEGDTGKKPSIALDSEGIAHIAYFDQTNGDLRYARQLEPDGWELVTVDSDGTVGLYASLVLDQGDQPHIAYLDLSNLTLKYAYFDGTDWQFQTIATDPSFDATISLALSQFGLPRITYRQSSGPQTYLGLGYASFDGTAWGVETAIDDPLAGAWSSLVLDQEDNPHISYSISSGGLGYLTKSDSWNNPESVATGVTAGSYNRLALNAQGNPGIVYFDGNENAVRLAFKDGSVWRKETLLASSNFPFITYGSDNVAHVSLVNTATNQLNYLHISPLPDLLITDIWQNGSTIHFQVRNAGLSDTPVDSIASLLINSSKVSNYTFPDAIPGGARVDASFSYTFNCSLGVQYAVQVDMNPGATFAESTRSNNSLAETWICQGQQPAIITKPAAVSIGQTSATIQWETNVASDSLVKFGRRPGTYESTLVATQTTNHSVALSGLTPGATYAYQVTSKNIANQTVSSDVYFFETNPAGGSVPTGITRSITRDPGTAEVFTLTASIPNASGAERVDFYYQLDETSPMLYIGSAYGGVSTEGGSSVEFQTKFSPGKTGLSRTDLASANIITQVSIPGGSTENFEDLMDAFQPLSPEIQITSPHPDFTYYVNQDTVPVGTTIPVSAFAIAYEWGCEWSGTSFAPDCNEVAKDVELVQFLITPGIRMQRDYEGTDHNYSAELDIGGLAIGDYHLNVSTISEGEEAFLNIPLHIARGKAKPVVDRKVYRVENSFTIVLNITNAADATDVLVIDSLIDNIRGFQPVFDNAGDIQLRSVYSPALRFNRVLIDIDQGSSETRTLDPGDSYEVSYRAIPILYEDNMIYEMGNIELAYTTDNQNQILLSNLPAAVAIDPSSVSPIPLTNSVSKALKLDDYLLVTHPGNLKTSFGTTGNEPNWNTLLRRMAQLAQLRQGALAFMDSQDAHALNLLLEPETPTWVDKLHPNFKEFARGYVLIVGEPGVMPSNSVEGLVYSITENERVDLTDNPFAHTGGNGAPDLVLGRIPGNNIPQLIKPIETSIKVLLGELTNDRSHALGSIGTGNHMSIFQSNANGHLTRLLDDGWTAMLLNEEEEVSISGPLNIPFDEGDLVAAGDINGDGNEEFVVGDISTDELWIVEIDNQGYSRTLWVEGAFDLRANTGFAVGNIDNDPQDELVIADYNDTIYIIDVDHPPFHHHFAYTDELVLANMDADAPLEIVIAQGGDVDIYNGDGSLLRSFELQVNIFDILVAGRIFDNFLPEELVLFDYSEQRAYIYSGYGALLDDFPVVFDMQDSIIVADVDNRVPDDYPAEIWATDWRHSYIKIYQSYGDQPSFTGIPQRLDDEEKLVRIEITGEDPSVWLMRRTDEAFQMDRNYAMHMQSLYASLADEMDYLFYRGHGSYLGWQSIDINTSAPLSFGNAAPFALGLTCESGYYGDDGDTFSEKMLWWGAGAFFGSTEDSASANNVSASDWIANHARDNEPFALTMLRYKNYKWGGKPLEGSSWAYWTHEYNFYGDPKFGYLGNTTAVNFLLDTADLVDPHAGAGGTVDSMEATKSTSLHVDIPDYQLTGMDGYDYVDIPGGDITTIDGQYRIPYYTMVLEYPNGERVSDVSLVARGGLTTTSGLNLPVYTTEIDGRTTAPGISLMKTTTPESEFTWLPDPTQVFSWDIAERSDGSSQLFIYINPFYYSPSTTAVEFYNSYDFSIDTISTKQQITSLKTDKSIYQLNEDILIESIIHNDSSSSTDVLVNAILSNAAGEDIAAAELHILEALAPEGNASYNATITTAGLPPGNYIVMLELRNVDGTVIDLETRDLAIGQPLAELKSLTVLPEDFQLGDTVQIQLTIASSGDLPLTEATAFLRIFDSNGELIAQAEQLITELAPDQSTEFSLPWDTTGMNGEPYTVSATVVYNSFSTPPLEVSFGDFNSEVYLPMLLR